MDKRKVFVRRLGHDEESQPFQCKSAAQFFSPSNAGLAGLLAVLGTIYIARFRRITSLSSRMVRGMWLGLRPHPSLST
jgi:hypothetical protein